MFHKVIHKVSDASAHADSIDCWCKPYIVSDPMVVEQAIVEQEMERQNMIDLFIDSRNCH